MRTARRVDPSARVDCGISTRPSARRTAPSGSSILVDTLVYLREGFPFIHGEVEAIYMLRYDTGRGYKTRAAELSARGRS